MTEKSNLSIEDVKDAAKRIEHLIHKTPILTCSSLDQLSGKQLFFKCENFQKIGAFKIRGASNAIQKLTDEQAKKGVVTHSSGNHGQALALAAKNRGIPAWVVMPKTSPMVKQNAISRQGATLILCENNFTSREETAEKIIQETGGLLIHPFNNLDVIAGQGTMALEILEQVPDADAIIASVSGGGMVSGICVAAKSLKPNIKVIASEPKGADDAYQSKRDGHIVRLSTINTCCDGLRANSVGPFTWPYIRDQVDKVITVSEENIKIATRLVWERMKIMVEPSAAISLAVALSDEFKEIPNIKKVVIVLSGGNVDLDEWKW